MTEQLKKLLVEKFQAEVRGDEYWMTPVGSIVTGTCWIVVRFGGRAARFRQAEVQIVDETLEDKVVFRHEEFFGDLINVVERRVEDLGELSPRAFGYGAFEAYEKWIIAKLVQSSLENFFKFVDAYEGGERHRGMKNIVWSLAHLKGPEYLRVLRNRAAREALL